MRGRLAFFLNHRSIGVGIALSLAAASGAVPAVSQVKCYDRAPVAAPAFGGPVRVGVTPPPPLPIETQPPIPAYGDLWTPGYWGWNPGLNDYYWIAGAWAAPPAIDLLWTPPWWGWNSGVYLFHPGYWGPTVGFYGGIRYGFGYFGAGYDGGYWRGRTFFYNRPYNNLGTMRVNAVFERRAVGDRRFERGERTSYNGGHGGVAAAPTAGELAAAREAHRGATLAQTRHFMVGAGDDRLRAGVNHGHPQVAETTTRADTDGHAYANHRHITSAPHHAGAIHHGRAVQARVAHFRRSHASSRPVHARSAYAHSDRTSRGGRPTPHRPAEGARGGPRRDKQPR
ncbi:MAG: hypothetical protein ABI056_05090 [Caulobacteraceae bacterium]